MKINKLIMVAGLLMVAGGLVFTILPHNIHNLINYSSHYEHKVFGYIFSLVGLTFSLVSLTVSAIGRKIL